jgi:hypothetical protein
MIMVIPTANTVFIIIILEAGLHQVGKQIASHWTAIHRLFKENATNHTVVLFPANVGDEDDFMLYNKIYELRLKLKIII